MNACKCPRGPGNASLRTSVHRKETWCFLKTPELGLVQPHPVVWLDIFPNFSQHLPQQPKRRSQSQERNCVLKISSGCFSKASILPGSRCGCVSWRGPEEALHGHSLPPGGLRHRLRTSGPAGEHSAHARLVRMQVIYSAGTGSGDPGVPNTAFGTGLGGRA